MGLEPHPAPPRPFPTDRPPVSVVVVNWNGVTYLPDCLGSIARQSYPSLEIVVVDNGSTDGSVALLRAAYGSRIHLIESPTNLGFAGANNVALRWVAARAPDAWALLLNNDAVVDPRAVSAMVREAERDDSGGAVGATVLRYHEPDRVETLAGGTISRLTGMSRGVRAGAARTDERPAAVAMDYVAGCCLLVSTTTLAEVGFMAEQFFLYGEDADWCLRMSRAGRPMQFASRAEIWQMKCRSEKYRS